MRRFSGQLDETRQNRQRPTVQRHMGRNHVAECQHGCTKPVAARMGIFNQKTFAGQRGGQAVDGALGHTHPLSQLAHAKLRLIVGKQAQQPQRVLQRRRSSDGRCSCHRISPP